MAPEHRSDTVDTLQLLHTGLLAGENVSSPNTTYRTVTFWDYEDLEDMVISIVIIIICLCGMVGNGIVIWLLGFHMKRNHYSVYILNLAIADFTCLLSKMLIVTTDFIYYPDDPRLFIYILELYSYSVGLSLLMAIGVERCAAVLWPIWYKCHRPAHMSTIVCALIWVLFLVFSLIIIISVIIEIKDMFIIDVMYTSGFLVSIPTFLVLFVSSLILFIQVQCYSKQRKPSRLYWTILINVLVFLLLSVPIGVFWACNFSMESSLHYFWSRIITILSTLNSTVNPIIYFFIGQHRQQGRRKPLQEVLQRALMDDNEEAE